MPAIFSERQKEILRQQLLDTGFDLLKKYGYRRMTIDILTKSCHIAKGTFYSFFKNKEDFLYEMMIYGRELERNKLTEHLSPDKTLTRCGFKAYVYSMLENDYNIFSFMSREETTLLMAAWPPKYLLNVSNDENTSLWILNMIPDKSPDCDWKLFVNYMKGLAIITNYKELLNADAAEASIERFIDDMIRYVWKD